MKKFSFLGLALLVASAVAAAFTTTKSVKKESAKLLRNGQIVQSPQGFTDCIAGGNACYTSNDNTGSQDHATTLDSPAN